MCVGKILDEYEKEIREVNTELQEDRDPDTMPSLLSSSSDSESYEPAIMKPVKGQLRKEVYRRLPKKMAEIQPLPASTEGSQSLETDVVHQTLRLYKHTVRVGVLKAQHAMLADVTRQIDPKTVD